MCLSSNTLAQIILLSSPFATITSSSIRYSTSFTCCSTVFFAQQYEEPAACKFSQACFFNLNFSPYPYSGHSKEASLKTTKIIIPFTFMPLSACHSVPFGVQIRDFTRLFGCLHYSLNAPYKLHERNKYFTAFINAG